MYKIMTEGTPKEIIDDLFYCLGELNDSQHIHCTLALAASKTRFVEVLRGFGFIVLPAPVSATLPAISQYNVYKIDKPEVVKNCDSIW